MEKSPNNVISDKAPPIANKTVLALTSLNLRNAKPSNKKPGNAIAKATFDKVENPFEKALSDPHQEITRSNPVGIKTGISDFLFSVVL